MAKKCYLISVTLILIMVTACTPVSQVESGANVIPGGDQQQTDPGGGSETPSVTNDPTPEEPEGRDIPGTCVRYSDEVRLFISDMQGYCLRYPAEYDVSVFSRNGVMFFMYSVLNASEPNLMIDVQPADGMTVEQAADQVAEAYAIPGEEPQRVEIILDGERAIALLGLTG